MWLPYNKILQNGDYLSNFINELFVALIIILKKYNVLESTIHKFKNEIINHVTGNSLYEYKENEDEILTNQIVSEMKIKYKHIST